jgi:hypothetical protein
VLFLDENERPVLPAHACPPLEMTSSRPSTTGDSVNQDRSDASDVTSLFSTPSFGSVRNETPTPSEGLESAVSPRTAHHVSHEVVEETATEQTFIGLLSIADDQALSPKTMPTTSIPEWVAKSTDCPVSAAMAAVLVREEKRHGKSAVTYPIAMDDSNISERDFGMRSRSSTMSSISASRSIKRKAIRPTPVWRPSEGASSSSAAPSEYQGEAPFQPPIESMVDAVAPLVSEIQSVPIATPQIEIPVDMPTGSIAEPIELVVHITEQDDVLPVNQLVKELILSPTESYFPTAADLTYASLAPLPPSPSRSSIYSTDSYTEDEEYETPSKVLPEIGTAVPYIPYKSEPLPTPTLRTPTSPLSRSASSASKSHEATLPTTPMLAAAAAATGLVVGAGVTHLASQKQASAQPPTATQRKWFERTEHKEMKFKFVLTPRNGAKGGSAGGRGKYVLPQADEDGRIIDPSAAAAAANKSTTSTSKQSTSSSSSAAAAAAQEKKADDSGSSGPTSSAQAGMPASVSLAQLARDPNELQRLLACTMFLLNDVPDKDAAPKRLDLGVMQGRGAGPGGFAMKHQTATDHEKEGLASGVRNVKWRVSMLG